MNTPKDVNSTVRPSRRRSIFHWIQRVVFVALAVVSVIVGWYVIARLTSPFRAVRIVENALPATIEPDPTPGILRIMTWNIAHGRGPGADNYNGETTKQRTARLEEIARIIRQVNAHIVVLNEVDFNAHWSGGVNQSELIARNAGYRYRMEQRNFDISLPLYSLAFGNVVLSHAPIVESESVEYPVRSLWEHWLAGSKQGSICDIELADRSIVRVVPVHLEQKWNSQEIRDGSAQAIRSVVQSGSAPAVIAGDFNDAPPRFQRVQARFLNRSSLSILAEDDLFHSRPVIFDESNIDSTYPSTNPDRVIDWILVPGDWQIISRTLIQTDRSDHLPVVMEVSRPSRE